MVAKIDQQGMYKRLPAIVVLCYFLATLDKILFTACSFSVQNAPQSCLFLLKTGQVKVCYNTPSELARVSWNFNAEKRPIR